MRRLLYLLLVALLAAACSAHRAPRVFDGAYAEEERGLGMSAAGYGAGGGGLGAPPAPARSRSKRVVQAAEVAPAPEPASGRPAPAPEAEARRVHYDGHAVLRVDDADAAAREVAALARAAGGRLEHMDARVVVVRVPVDRFREVFERVLGIGEVVRRSIAARDVTEAWSDLDLRLRTARATRDRLVALLARSRDEKEKLRLLQEIQRVTEEIDRLEAQLRILADLAAFSRITVELQEREPAVALSPAEEPVAELAWIRALSPFEDDVLSEARRLAVPVPEGMVALSPRGPFVAESADGARLRTGRLRPGIRADAAFWLDAIEERLAGDFREAERLEVGPWCVLRLVSHGEDPFTWWVGVRVRGEGARLDVLELTFPSPSAEEALRDAVVSALSGGAA